MTIPQTQPVKYFDIEAALNALRSKPLQIDTALNMGFGAYQSEINNPDYGLKRKAMFKFFEDQIFTEENLRGFKAKIEDSSLGLSKKQVSTMREQVRPPIGRFDMSERLENLLGHLDVIIGRLTSDSFAAPLIKTIEAKSDQVLTVLKEYFRLDPSVQGVDEMTADEAVKLMSEQVREGFRNMSSIYLGILRIAPKLFKSKPTEEEFSKVIRNIKNLLKRYASTHVLKLKFFREIIAYDELSEILTSASNGWGTRRYPAKGKQQDDCPDYYHFRPDCFQIINTDEGGQIVNSEKLLHRYHDAIELGKLDGQELSTDKKSYVAKVLHQINSTPTLGCPLTRVTVAGENFIDITFKWLEALTHEYYFKAGRNLGFFAKKLS